LSYFGLNVRDTSNLVASPYVRCQKAFGKRRKVDMGINKTGYDRHTMAIDDFRVIISRFVQLRVVSNAGYPATTDLYQFRVGQNTIQSNHIGIGQNQFGGKGLFRHIHKVNSAHISIKMMVG
jgi:hypothetical protein